jgi:hypothetical protein
MPDSPSLSDRHFQIGINVLSILSFARVHNQSLPLRDISGVRGWPRPSSVQGVSCAAVDRSAEAERINGVLRPDEAVIAQAVCCKGRWVTESSTKYLVAVTNERCLVFLPKGAWKLRNSGKLLQEIDLDRIRTVESKTAHPILLLGIPHVRTRLEYDDGQVMQLVNSGFGARSGRLLAKTLTDRVGASRPNMTDIPPE